MVFRRKKKLVSPSDKKIKQMKADYIKSKQDIIEKIAKEVSASDPKGKTHISYSQVLNTRRMKKYNISAHSKAEAAKLAQEWGASIKKLRGLKNLGYFGPIIGAVVSFVIGSAYATKMQVGSSKIARFQARKVLEDPKYFVKYTPEQIAEAKRVLDSQDEKTKKKKKTKTDKLKGGMFKSFFSLARDGKAYKNWKKNYNETSQKISRPLTQEETIQAKKDQEVIQRVVKKINNNAELYSENMEVASEVLINSTPFLGAGVGLIVSKIMNMTNVNPNYVQKFVNKNGSEEAKAAYEVLKNAPKNAQNKLKLFKNFSEAMLNSKTEELADTKGISAIIAYAKKLIPTAISTKMGKNIVFGAVGAAVTGTVGLIMGLKLQKASARAGRYEAKRELEANPENFIGYTREEFDEVPAGTPKKKQSKFKQYALFIPNVMKQYYRYNHYKKHELREDKLLQDELVKLNVSDAQLKDAKNLQGKIFNTFEKVDEKSQNYSESVEMAAETAKPFVAAGGILAMLSPVIIFIIQAARGKVTTKSVANKIISLCSKITWVTKQKFFKKYLKDVAQKTSELTREVKIEDVPNTILKKALADVNLRNIVERKGNFTIGESFDDITNLIKNLDDKEYLELINKIQQPLIKKGKSAPIDYALIGKDNIIKALAALKTVMPDLKLNEVISAQNPLKTDRLIDGLTSFVTKLSDEDLAQKASKISEGLKNLLKMTGVEDEKMAGFINEIDTMLKNNVTKANIADKINEFKSSIGNKQLIPDEILQKIDRVTNPKLGAELDKIKKAIDNMNDAEFKTYMEKYIDKLDSKGYSINLDLSSIDRAFAQKNITRIQKILKNIPKEEFKQLMYTCIEEFNKNPDQFMYLLKTGKLTAAFNTAGMRKALAAAGVTWVVFNASLTYLIEAWLADMQLKAGRLGVMKALDELQDPAYYANIEPTNGQTSGDTQKTVTDASLINKFKK